MVKPSEKSPKKAGIAGLSDAGRSFDPGFAGRLAAVINDFDSRQAASAAAGVNPDQLARYLREAAQPAFETVARLAAARGFSLDWVWSGAGTRKPAATEEVGAEMVQIPVLDIRAGAGSEQFIVDEAPVSSLQLPRTYLIQHGIRPQHARLMFGAGDSMVPTVQDRAPMVVDTSDEGERDDVYVMRRGDGIIVKRLQHLANGSLILKADNPAYAPETLPRDEADELRVIGRVGLVLQEI